MTKQTSKPDIQQDFENCILNVHGILRKLSRSYCYFINELKSNNNKTSDISLAEKKQLSAPGIILVGQTGVGKTELAHFLGKITESIVIPVEMSDLISSEIGATAVNVHKEFERARQKARNHQKPVILIFDEIDRIARYINIETAQAVELRAGYQQFNSEVDRCKKDGDIFVVGTTNYINECAPEFRNRLTEISITEPLNADERKPVLSWYIMHPKHIRILQSKDLATVYQTIREALPIDRYSTFDELMQPMKQLDKELILLETWSPTAFQFFVVHSSYIAKLEAIVQDLKQSIAGFDSLSFKHDSLKTISSVKTIVGLQVEKLIHYLALHKLFVSNGHLINEIAQKTNAWNFRELEKLSLKIRNYSEPLTEEIILTWINAIEKARLDQLRSDFGEKDATSCEKNSADYVETGLNVISWTAKIASYFF